MDRLDCNATRRVAGRAGSARGRKGHQDEGCVAFTNSSGSPSAAAVGVATASAGGCGRRNASGCSWPASRGTQLPLAADIDVADSATPVAGAWPYGTSRRSAFDRLMPSDGQPVADGASASHCWRAPMTAGSSGIVTVCTTVVLPRPAGGGASTKPFHRVGHQRAGAAAGRVEAVGAEHQERVRRRVGECRGLPGRVVTSTRAPIAATVARPSRCPGRRAGRSAMCAAYRRARPPG